jgi:lipoprotein-anchoring transpeptidase ErfK/SrfK
VHTGFGLHGTIDPTSIGQSKSMGCVRMGNEDIAVIYELLVEQISQVRVVPN